MTISEQELVENLQREIARKEKAHRESRTLLAQTVYLGTIGIMLSLPIVVGAYLGQWLDEKTEGFSFSWTVSLIVIGVAVGGLNVYLLVRENQ